MSENRVFENGRLKNKGMDLSMKMQKVSIAVIMKLSDIRAQMARKLSETRGQGTTEYAILVGVLVVIAIIAVIAFRGKLQELWNSITEGINGL